MSLLDFTVGSYDSTHISFHKKNRIRTTTMAPEEPSKITYHLFMDNGYILRLTSEEDVDTYETHLSS